MLDSALGVLVRPITIMAEGIDRLANFLGDKVDTVKSKVIRSLDFLNSIWDSIKNIPSRIWEVFKAILNNIWEGIKSLPSFIWEVFKTIITNIWEGIKNIVEFLVKFFENLKEFFKMIFVPKEDYFANNFDTIKNTFTAKLGNPEEKLKPLKTIGGASIEDVEGTLSVGGVTVSTKIIDFSFINKYKSNFQNWIRGFFWVFMLLFNINKAYFLIRGKYLFNVGRGGQITEGTGEKGGN